MKYHAKKHITAAISYVITIFRVVCFKKQIGINQGKTGGVLPPFFCLRVSV